MECLVSRHFLLSFFILIGLWIKIFLLRYWFLPYFSFWVYNILVFYDIHLRLLDDVLQPHFGFLVLAMVYL